MLYNETVFTELPLGAIVMTAVFSLINVNNINKLQQLSKYRRNKKPQMALISKKLIDRTKKNVKFNITQRQKWLKRQCFENDK